jgi:hypothetical protein
MDLMALFDTRKLKLHPSELMAFPAGSAIPLPDEAMWTDIARGKYGVNNMENPLIVIQKATRRRRRFWFW